MTRPDFAICPFAEQNGAVLSDIDRIFFEASTIRSFASEAAKSAFRERWLGRYLDRVPENAFIAVRGTSTVGYIVGAAKGNAMFDDIPSTTIFADLLPRFPAHLHINVASDARGAGVGSRLMEVFLGHMRRLGVPGVHLVTSEGSRNIGFYQHNGFRIEALRPADDRVLVFMGRAP
ncbi:MAG: GNAT family N-acetyltransferase [Hyphomicrobiaceae bacterium]|nr:MAG: GNAT family N-acetyltransferase [Hyphomicrobiaceae bacterium]